MRVESFGSKLVVLDCLLEVLFLIIFLSFYRIGKCFISFLYFVKYLIISFENIRMIELRQLIIFLFYILLRTSRLDV